MVESGVRLQPKDEFRGQVSSEVGCHCLPPWTSLVAAHPDPHQSHACFLRETGLTCAIQGRAPCNITDTCSGWPEILEAQCEGRSGSRSHVEMFCGLRKDTRRWPVREGITSSSRFSRWVAEGFKDE